MQDDGGAPANDDNGRGQIPIEPPAFAAYRAQFVRFLIGGNAGAAILVSTIIGTHLARGGDISIPTPIFWLFVTFLIGLLGSWFGMVADGLWIIAGEKARQSGLSDTTRAQLRTSHWISNVTYSVSSLCLIGGGTAGVIYLYGFVG